jgi:hypothetical protein
MAGYTGSHNPLLANYFEFTLSRVPNMVYFCQTANIPGILFGTDTQPTALGFPVNIPIGNYKFENLQITFKVDENLRNWLEIFEWMKGNGNFGESCNAYPYTSSTAGALTKTTSDASLIITNSVYRPKIKVNFNHLFPVSLSGIAFSTILPESVEVVATAEFAFSGYTIQNISNT